LQEKTAHAADHRLAVLEDEEDLTTVCERRAPVGEFPGVGIAAEGREQDSRDRDREDPLRQLAEAEGLFDCRRPKSTRSTPRIAPQDCVRNPPGALAKSAGMPRILAGRLLEQGFEQIGLRAKPRGLLALPKALVFARRRSLLSDLRADGRGDFLLGQDPTAHVAGTWPLCRAGDRAISRRLEIRVRGNRLGIVDRAQGRADRVHRYPIPGFPCPTETSSEA